MLISMLWSIVSGCVTKNSQSRGILIFEKNVSIEEAEKNRSHRPLEIIDLTET
jgi:hypothetical protein